MKTLKKQIKIISFFLIVSMLFQSCKVYHRDSVTLEQAVKEGKGTKITTLNNKTLKFKSVVLEEGNFFGVKKVKGELIKMPIDDNEVKRVNVLNKGFSTAVSVLLPLAVIIGVLVIVTSLDFAPDFGGSGY